MLILGDFNNSLSINDTSSKQNINRNIVELNDTLDQMDLTDTYRTFHSKAAKYTFFSNAYGIFSKIDHMIGYKRTLKKFKKIKIISSIFSDNQSMKLEAKLKEKTQKQSNLWTLNSMLLNNEWVYSDFKEEIRKFLETT